MSPNSDTSFPVAAIQATPVFLDRDATVSKACSLIEEAGRQGVRFAVFPECFVPAYPLWVWFIPAGRTHELRTLYTELVKNAVVIPSEATAQLCSAARASRVNVAMGVNEINAEASGMTLYNTILFISDEGVIVGKHRKLVPTAGERLVHGRGDGSTLEVFDTSIGRVGGLVCWEYYMPLVKYAMYAEGVQILAAPSWDRGEPWISTLRHTAKEGRAYVIGCGMPLRREDIPDRLAFKKEYLPDREWLNPGGGTIIDPDGKFLVEPVNNEERILVAEVDPVHLVGPRFQLDVAGHYARPDIFELTVHRETRPLIRHTGVRPDADENGTGSHGEEDRDQRMDQSGT